MNKFTFPLLIVITTICIYQFSKNKQNIKYINYMNEIIESKNLMINNLLKDDLYDINRDLYSYIYNIDSSLLENNQKTTLCIYISAEKHCDACIEFELKYIRKNALENIIIILYHASHKSSFNSFKEFNKDFHSIYFCPENTKFNDFPTYIIINEGIIKHIYKSNTNRNGGALNYFLNTLKNFLK